MSKNSKLRPGQMQALEEQRTERSGFAVRVEKGFVRKDEKWVPVDSNDIKAITVGELLDGSKRLMASVEYDTDKRAYITCTEEDRDSLRIKYPNALVICFGQILGLFKRSHDGEFTTNFLKTIMVFMAEMPFEMQNANLADVKDLREQDGENKNDTKASD